MSYSELYIKKPGIESSLSTEIKMMLDVIKPSYTSLTRGFIKHLLYVNPEGITMDNLVQILDKVTSIDENYDLEEEDYLKVIRSDSAMTIERKTHKDTEFELLRLSDGVERDELYYVFPYIYLGEYLKIVQAINKQSNSKEKKTKRKKVSLKSRS